MNKTYQSYYTKSDPILSYMVNKLNIKSGDAIFEPCGGDGVFIDKILDLSIESDITIYELNPNAIETLKKKYSSNNNIRIKQTDTLLDESVLFRSQQYDKIIGNPPYGASKDANRISLLKKLYDNMYVSESYTLFLYACINLLKEGGTLSFIIPDTFLTLNMHQGIRQFILRYCKIKELLLFPSSFFPGINFGYANLCIITLDKCSNIIESLNNKFSIRNNFKSVDDICSNNEHDQIIVSQQDIYSNIASSFLLGANDSIRDLINNSSILKIGDIASCVTGFYSGNDKKYLHPISGDIKNSKRYKVVNSDEIYWGTLTAEQKEKGLAGKKRFVPIVKGGNVRYLKPDSWFMDWSEQAIKEYKESKKCRFQNSNYYFREGIAIPMVRSKCLTASLISSRLFDQSIVGVFPLDIKYLHYLLAFFNSKTCSKLIQAINSSTNNSANYIKRIPFIEPDDSVLKETDSIIASLKTSMSNNDDISEFVKKLDSIFEELYGF